MAQGELRPFPRERLNVRKECVCPSCVQNPGKPHEISINLPNVSCWHGDIYLIYKRIEGY